MSREIKLDHEFDKKEFQRLLRLAIGPHTIKEFSAITDIAVTTFSKHLNGCRNVPPNPNILFRITQASDNRISTADLLNAAGYDVNKYLYHNSSLPELSASDTFFVTHEHPEKMLEKYYANSYHFDHVLDRAIMHGDFGLGIKNSDIEKWYFRVLFSAYHSSPFDLAESINDYYMARHFTTLRFKESIAKYSVITDNHEVYDYILKLDYSDIIIPASIILISKADDSIISESNLKTQYNEYTLHLSDKYIG